ncbi:MAG: Uncharacterised protein [SAR116 cluster bacterium]|nr:MAG: Uncharacterised protein [SAR116 cluster bacterium]
MHGAAGLFLHRLCHEGSMYIVIKRCLPDCTLEQKGLVGQFQRLAMIEINLHLRRARLMAERVDVDLLHFTMIVNILKQRIEFIHRIDAISLSGLFSASGPSAWCGQRAVGICALLHEEEFQFRCHNRTQSG